MNGHRKILRTPMVTSMTGLSLSTLYRKEKAGTFPARIQISDNAVGYFEDEVIEYINSCPRGVCAAPVAANAARRGG